MSCVAYCWDSYSQPSLQVKELLAAQQRAKDGVIHFTPATFSKHVTGKQRPFAVFLFLTANHLLDKPQLGLGPMRKEFGYLAKAFKDRIAKGEVEKPGTIFFAEAEFKESQEVRIHSLTLHCRLQAADM